MKKFGAIFVTLLFGLLVAAATYAYWSQTLTVSGTVGTGILDANITAATTGDNENVYDVGAINYAIAQDLKSATITITNAYPGYVAWANFSVTNTGTIPVKLSDTVNNPNSEIDVTTSWTGLDSNGVLLPGQTAHLNVTTTVTDLAAQNSTYTFTVTISVEQFNAP